MSTLSSPTCILGFAIRVCLGSHPFKRIQHLNQLEYSGQAAPPLPDEAAPGVPIEAAPLNRVVYLGIF